MDESSTISHAVKEVHDGESKFLSFLDIVICIVIESALEFLDYSS